jgi:1,4-alpha-glucan branching enzyme
MAKRKDNSNDEKENSLNAGAGNRNFDPYVDKKNQDFNPEEDQRQFIENRDDDNSTRNEGKINPAKSSNRKKKGSITEDELKMPDASGDKKGPLSAGKSKTGKQVENELSEKMEEAEKGTPDNKEDGFPRSETYTQGKTTQDKKPAKVPKASKGELKDKGKDSKGAGTKKSGTRAKAKEPSKITQAPRGRFEDSEDTPVAETLKRKTGAQAKTPAKLNQPAKGRFEEKSSEASSKRSGKSSGSGDITGNSNDKINLPEHTSSSESSTVESGNLEGPQKQRTGRSIKNVSSSAKKTTGKKESTAKSKTSATNKKSKEKISPGPEVKGSGRKSKEKKVESSDTNITEDLKDMAMSTAAKIANKILPDEETRNEIAKTAKEILPDQEDIQKSIKKAKNKFSPEIEQVNKIVDKFISPDDIKEKSEKIKTSAKNIKNKSQERSQEKTFKEMSLISDYDVHLFKEGRHFHLYKKFGSHLMDHKGTSGVYFAVWAPNAKNVSVIGDFNNWIKMANPMKSRPDESGIWEVFIPEAKQGSLYKYFIQSNSGYEAEKGDPFAFMWEVPPSTASVVWDLKSDWGDEEWLTQRKINAGKAKPVSVYEMHIGSWRRVPEDGNRSLTYKEMAAQLPAYLNKMGFTHVEFMPVMEHPFFGSWGYQVTGYFAPSSRFGNPEDFMGLIDALHRAGIGVILDWVPSHFPSDLHGLHYFDGTFLYEHEDPQKGFHPDWQSYIFNYDRNEVRSFLISNALFWLDKFHADGLRVDAVASMLYLDYSRKHGEWQPNKHGGNEDLEAISFLKQFNEVVYSEFPDTMTIAEESTAWPMVSRPTYMGGLGFGMKWMMGWMHDTLEYFKKDPVHRKHHQDTITFSTNYAFTENFMLPLSHDEVVYGKKSLLNKMPGDQWNKFSNLRALYSYMFAHPGTKLLFMGAEFAQIEEWGHDTSLDWHLTHEGPHREMQETITALNRIYTGEPAFYEKAFDPEGFEWVDFNDRDSSIISFLRKGNDPKDTILVACNLTPIPRENYRIGVPTEGNWKEIFNSDDRNFGGSNVKNPENMKSSKMPMHRQDYSIAVTLPPMGVIYLKSY